LMYTYKMNATAFAAKGNGGNSSPYYPSDYEYAFAVGALRNDNTRADFSNYGNGIDAMAPGVDVYSCRGWASNAYGYASGTSMATPHVTGLASLIMSLNTALYNDDVYWIIRYSSHDMAEYPATPGYDDYTGWGRIDAFKALSMLHSPYAMHHETHQGGSVYHIGEWGSYPFFDIPGLPDGQKMSRRYEVRADVTFPESFPNQVFAWGRGLGTVGYHYSYHFGQGWCGVVDGSLTSAGCQLQTYVYELKDILGHGLGFFPCEPQNVSFEYTVLGIPAEPSCCMGIRGNVNGDPEESIDISDMTYLTDYMYRHGPPPPCMDEGNVNGTGEIDVSDLVYLSNYMFHYGPPPPWCP
jgi:hypothetical protein